MADLPYPAHLYHNKFADKNALSVNFQAAPIPEPETCAMVLAGLGLISAISRFVMSYVSGHHDLQVFLIPVAYPSHRTVYFQDILICG